MGRPSLAVWKYTTKFNASHVKCKSCAKVLAKNATRIRSHLDKCQPFLRSNSTVSTVSSSGPRGINSTEIRRPMGDILCQTDKTRPTTEPSSQTTDSWSPVKTGPTVETINIGCTKPARFFDRMSQQQHDQAQEKFARAVFASGCPLSLFDTV